MTLCKLALAGYLAGAFVIVASTVRWFFLWPDISQLVLADSIGVLILFGSYVYNWMRMKDEQLRKIDKRLDSVVVWWMGLEKDEVMNTARGKDDDSS